MLAESSYHMRKQFIFGQQNNCRCRLGNILRRRCNARQKRDQPFLLINGGFRKFPGYNTVMFIDTFLNIAFTEEQVRVAISETSFETLKKSEEKYGFKEKLPSCDAFFRHGKAGGWRSFLTESQIRKIVSDHHEVMGRFGYIEL